MDKIKEIIAEHIKEMRLVAGLSKAQLARKIKTGNDSIYKYENKKAVPGTMPFLRIAKACKQISKGNFTKKDIARLIEIAWRRTDLSQSKFVNEINNQCKFNLSAKQLSLYVSGKRIPQANYFYGIIYTGLNLVKNEYSNVYDYIDNLSPFL